MNFPYELKRAIEAYQVTQNKPSFSAACSELSHIGHKATLPRKKIHKLLSQKDSLEPDELCFIDMSQKVDHIAKNLPSNAKEVEELQLYFPDELYATFQHIAGKRQIRIKQLVLGRVLLGIAIVSYYNRLRAETKKALEQGITDDTWWHFVEKEKILTHIQYDVLDLVRGIGSFGQLANFEQAKNTLYSELKGRGIIKQ